MTFTTLASAAALSLSLLAAAPSSAQTFEKIDVAMTVDAERLETAPEAAYADLVAQAETACTVTYGLSVLGADIDRTCVAELLDATVSAVGSDVLLRVHAASNTPAQFAARD